MALIRKQRKLDDIILTMAAYPYIKYRRQRDTALAVLFTDIAKYLGGGSWAA